MTAMTIPPIQALLDAGPDAVRSFLQAMRYRNAAFQHVAWHSLAEGAATKARFENDLLWARIALHAYRRWTRAESRAAESARQSSMMLRAYFIAQCGAESDSRVCNLRSLVAEFYDDLPLTLEEARELSRDWRAHDLATIVKLRTTKNRLAPLKLVGEVLERQYPSTAAWLTLRDDLP